MVASGRSTLSLASTFAGAASSYWLGIFPLVGREVRHWHARAREIPDPVLRRHALDTQDSERGNLEGAAAFAVLVPRAHRELVVRAVVAFQAVYDYIDTLAEQPCADPVANGRQLHLALLSALDPASDHADYYEHTLGRADAGYMCNLVDTCRYTFGSLPSHASVMQPALRAARRMVTYQALNHGEGPGEHTHAALERWAGQITPAGSGLRWWETAAGAASSLTVFALIAAAARPCVDVMEALATERAYFPWIGALHVLLDSLIDHREDRETEQHSLIDHYSCAEEAAVRLSAIAARAMRSAELLPDGPRHAAILAAMTSFYLSAPSTSMPATLPAAKRVLEAMGALAAPTMAVLRARRAASWLHRRCTSTAVWPAT